MIDFLLSKDTLDDLAHYHRLWVGFSGGLDSSVLLHYLAAEPLLAGKLQAVHIHHGLSAHATAWQVHCQHFCSENNIPLIIREVQFDAKANIEERARAARYEVFASLVEENDALVLAHHADDQAETLLLQLCRGSGVDGLAAMPSRKYWAKGALLRPFLHHSRQQLEAYAEQFHLTWVEDESNQNLTFSRNYLRQQIMPLLKERWPGVVSGLARSAAHCQQAKNNLENLAAMDCMAIGGYEDTLSLEPLKALSYDRLANALRGWLKYNQVRCPSTNRLNRLIEDVIEAPQDAMPVIEWDETKVCRYQQKLYLLQRTDGPFVLSSELVWAKFPEPLLLAENLGLALIAIHSETGLVVPPGCQVKVRYRQGGELFYWHGQTKQLKKLWQQWQVPPWLRDRVPLIYLNDDLAAVVGYAISDQHWGKRGSSIYRIEQQARDFLKND